MTLRNLAGQTFGRLTVLGRADSSPQRKVMWRCRCSCGREIVTQGVYLSKGDTRSCGCLHREAAIANGRAHKIDIAGQRFGRLIAINVCGRSCNGRGELLWNCRCNCGRMHTVSGSRLRNGACQSCGCLRDEWRRAHAKTLGSIKRIKRCRTCGRIYKGTGAQKECSRACRKLHHAREEAQRRQQIAEIELARGATQIAKELQRRKEHANG